MLSYSILNVVGSLPGCLYKCLVTRRFCVAKFDADGAAAMSTDIQMGKVSLANEQLDGSDDQDGLKTRDPFSTLLGPMRLSVLVIS